jgi:hypothetical protein
MQFLLCCRCYTPMFDEEQLLLAFAWAFTNTLMLVRSSTTTVPALTRSDHCLGCQYDLQGLPGAGVCPECGAPFDDTQLPQRTRTRLTLDWPRTRGHLLPVLFFAAALFFGRHLLWPALVLGHLADDRPLSNAVWSASREVQNGVLYGWLPIPLIMALTPLTSWLPRRSWQATLTITLLLLTLAWAAAVTPNIPERWRG